MRKLFLFFCFIFYSQLFSQTTYVFNAILNDKNNAPALEKRNGMFVYNGSNPEESKFFSNYKIYNFYATYPSYSGYLLNVFTFVTSSSSLMDDLKKHFPSIYLETEDLTGMKVELVSSYPNDYGNGVNYYNPITNLGANISLKSFDYIGAPKAWGFFPNSSPKGNVTIGVSDGMVNTSDIDLDSTKVSYFHQNLFNSTFNCSDSGFESRHGTTIAAIAAAQGNNAHGITGICYDCDILNIPYTVDVNQPNYNGLMELAHSGVRVINMSWIQGYHYNDASFYSAFVPTQQLAINQLFEMGVVLVAGAGNQGSYTAAAAPNYLVRCYPASYEHVISVTVVHSKNHSITDEIYQNDPVYGDHSYYNEDIIASVGGILDLNNPVFVPFIEWATTTNAEVDICGPAYAPYYGNYLLGCSDLYADATSSATPFVTGTVALMQSLNSCILPEEVEDVIQLTSKNLEIKPENSAFIGRSGSGKLETGDAVEFTHEMMVSNGNALVDGQDFWRFDFDLKHIFNGLTISNQIFRDQNTTNFTAKNFIDISQNVDLRPGRTGFVDLNINSELQVCGEQSSKFIKNNTSTIEDKDIASKFVSLYPNPNKGSFSILVKRNTTKDVAVTILDVYGKIVYTEKINKNEFELNVNNFPNGMYFVKLSSDEINETLKFVKE